MVKSISSCNLSQISTLVFLSSILFSFYSLSSAKIQPFFLYNCTSNSSTLAPGTTFQYNLNTLFSSLSSKAGTNNTFFYNTTSGDANTKDSTFYGLFMCRGDSTSETCRECVTNSTNTLASNCSFHKQAVIWHEECMVRYSNKPFFSTMDENPMRCVSNKEDQRGQLDQFNSAFTSLMKDLIDQASDVPMSSNSKKFAVKEQILVGWGSLFGLAQCTPDLSRDDCRQCLKDGVAYLENKCARGKIGARVLYPSCTVRYEPYLFFSRALVTDKGKRSIPSPTLFIFVGATVNLVVIFGFGWCLMRRKARKDLMHLKENSEEAIDAEMKSLQFNLGTIEDATNNFSAENKIGEGGFGEVYKGMLFNGQEIAVKRLSRNSKQGAVEFKNEVLLIAKLQHRNLVRLLGFCMEEEEKILVYEFLSNRSLDYYLFSLNKRLLTWFERYKIIRGIARGILYLHEDSRLKIIHRDLKPSNILLDNAMDPKISDFGMAKIVDMDQRQGNTQRIAGSYGYMSREYAMYGQFSVKSDVFSFGVIVLEIVSGKRNAYFEESDYDDDLVSYAWRKWRDQRPLELMDSRLKETFSEIEVIRCIQIGLLCVQENPDDRPTMATIALYFNIFSVDLPLPREPAFFMRGKTESSMPKKLECAESMSFSIALSVNEIQKSQ